MILHRYRSRFDNRPEARLEGEWADVVELLGTHRATACSPCPGRECPAKRNGVAYSFGELRPGTTRAAHNVAHVHALAFDIDHGDGPRLGETVRRLKAEGRRALLVSTHSSRAGAPKARLVLDVTRPMLPGEFSRLWPALEERLALGADPSAKDASRLYFGPTHPADEKPFGLSYEGQPLDVDGELARLPPVRTVTVPAPRTGAEWLEVLASLGEGGRNVGLAQVGGLLFAKLPLALAEELLHALNQTRCTPPLDDEEVNTIAESLARRELAR